jgi:RimJ/RimL family protein N-acetyltransferase
MICLPAVTSSLDTAITLPVPIGYLGMGAPSGSNSIHRRATIGINISAAHQRKGYGTEAILWALAYGFECAGMHRIGLGHVGWNPDAGKLYEKLGFKQESVRRDFWWAYGRFWDSIELSMLEDEWREKYRREGL